MNIESECFCPQLSIVFERMDIPVGHELNLFRSKSLKTGRGRVATVESCVESIQKL